MKTTFKTNFEFYYDENMMDIPQTVLENEALSPAAKNIYIYIVYFITEEIEDIMRALKESDECRHDFETGFSELIAAGFIEHVISDEEEQYIVKKEV
ncbi:MAG TPA: hypothetical protein DCY20_00400 [Firmicutes bacterium]|nr:hypothetical protein [Bacillota bacterium]